MEVNLFFLIQDKYHIYTTEISSSIGNEKCIMGKKYKTDLRYYICDGRPVPKFIYKEWRDKYQAEPQCESFSFKIFWV